MRDAVVIGASSGVGRALADALASQGSDLVLVARNAEDLEPTAADLRVRYRVHCRAVAADIGTPDWSATDFASFCLDELGALDIVYITAGAVFPPDDPLDPADLASVTSTNFLGPARVAAAFADVMFWRRRGAIVLVSSIAAAAPRGLNAAYSASKQALESFARSLRFRLQGSGVSVGVLVLGYADTALAHGLPLRLPMVRPSAVARYLVRRGAFEGRTHYPRFWAPTTLVLRHLPWFIYRRMRF